MEAASPARLYVSVAGALLLVLGIVGFFYSASFGSPGPVETALGALRVNAWLNVIQIAVGALALLFAEAAPRPAALALGGFCTALAIWGFAVSGETILGFLPAGAGEGALHLVLGLLGLAAAAGTPRHRPAPRGGDAPHEPGDEPSEPRPQAASKRP